MSQVYATEPPTTGRVILETSHGPLDIELWCKECPTTTRMFLQLCLDGYYDSAIFHRIMENFLIQIGQVKFDGGAARDIASGEDMKQYLLNHASSAETAAADGSQSNRRKLEVSPRIRFNHRGQVACALTLDEDLEDNASADALRSQFFITLDESSFLDGKHVIIGSIEAPTVFNALRIGKVAVDDASQPVDMDLSPPVIKNVKICHHPFNDLVPTPDDMVPWKRGAKDGPGDGGAGDESQIQKCRKKRKGKRDLNVLSFGQEMEDDTGGDGVFGNSGASAGGGMRSSHDVLSGESKFLSSSIDEGVKVAAANDGSQRRSKKKRREEERRSEIGNVPGRKVAPMGHTIGDAEPTSRERDYRDYHRPKREEDIGIKSRAKDSRKEKSSDRRSDEQAEKNVVSAVEARRAKYLKGGASRRSGGKDKSKDEEDTMKKLSLFRSKMLQSKGKSNQASSNSSHGIGVSGNDNSLAARMAMRSMKEQQEIRDREESMAPTYHGQVLEDDDDDDDSDAGATSSGWMKTKFKCRKHIDHGAKIDEADDGQKAGDGRKIDDYEVVDGKTDRDNDRQSGEKRQDKHYRGGGHKRHGGGDDRRHKPHRTHQHHHRHHERSNGGGRNRR